MAITEIPLKVRLSSNAAEKLAQRAAERGGDLSQLASELLEQAATRQSVDEILADYRRQVAESGMTDEELDNFHRELLDKVRSEKAKSA